jgi:hypothetical protein
LIPDALAGLLRRKSHPDDILAENFASEVLRYSSGIHRAFPTSGLRDLRATRKQQFNEGYDDEYTAHKTSMDRSALEWSDELSTAGNGFWPNRTDPWPSRAGAQTAAPSNKTGKDVVDQ